MSCIANPGAHGLSEVLYAFSSVSNNNGSAFAGLNANVTFYNTALGLAMLFGRYWPAVPVLAIAGSLARKKTVPSVRAPCRPISRRSLSWLALVILVGALTFFPALALGPIVEHLHAGEATDNDHMAARELDSLFDLPIIRRRSIDSFGN